MGKPMVILPPLGNPTGINSAKVDKTRKKININRILGEKDKEENKYIKRPIAPPVTTPI